jgi:spore germination protein YaaH
MYWAAVLSALLCCAPVLHVAAAPKEVVAFTNSKYDGWQQWNWDAITILGFWTNPPDDVRTKARSSGVRLFADSHLPDSKDWEDKDKRKKWVKEKVKQVTSDKLDGVLFDYEGELDKNAKAAYTQLAQETTAALKPLNASIFICVGARPSYEARNYDYKGLAAASDFLFIMGYDAHFWDDYTCVLKGTCSPAEAPLKDVGAGVSEYLQQVKAEKLVLGLPWYGQRYTQVVLPINEGQIDYKDVLAVLDDKKRVKKKELDKDSQTWVITCNGACVDGKKGGKIWIDDATTLKTKYALAAENTLRGVGVWEITKLDYSGKHNDTRDAMWTALAAWDA